MTEDWGEGIHTRQIPEAISVKSQIIERVDKQMQLKAAWIEERNDLLDEWR